MPSRALPPCLSSARVAAISLLALNSLAGCGAAEPASAQQALVGDAGPVVTIATVATPARYATSVVSLTVGDGGGYGQDQLPTIIAGPPHGGGCCYGSTDVLSLGNGGEVVIGFAPGQEIVDGDGPDFIVFENAFEIADDPKNVFTELGEVSVSEDGVTWATFACDPTAGPPSYGDCAGWRPVYASVEQPVDVASSAKAGGDAFDLATIGVKKAKFVRIRDLRSDRPAQQKMAGFDLDAIAVLHW